MDQHRLHAKRIGHQTGMLSACAAKAVEQVSGHVIAALHRDFLDGVGHVLDRDCDETLRHGLGRASVSDLCRQCLEFCAHRFGIQRLVLRGAEDGGEEKARQDWERIMQNMQNGVNFPGNPWNGPDDDDSGDDQDDDDSLN